MGELEGRPALEPRAAPEGRAATEALVAPSRSARRVPPGLRERPVRVARTDSQVQTVSPERWRSCSDPRYVEPSAEGVASPGSRPFPLLRRGTAGPPSASRFMARPERKPSIAAFGD